MKTKKFVVFALCLLLAVSAVFANGEKDAADGEKTTLRVAMECSYTPFN